MCLREDMIESLPCIIDINRHRPRCRIVIAAFYYQFKKRDMLARFAFKFHGMQAKLYGHQIAPSLVCLATTTIGRAGGAVNAAPVTYACSSIGELAGIFTGRRADP